MKSKILAIIVVCFLSACAPAPTATPTASATATSVAQVAPTATDAPTPTTAPTETATATSTRMQTATATNTATNTATVTLTRTPTNTPLPTKTATPRPVTLRSLADKIGFKIGSQIIWEGLIDTRISKKYAAIASDEFNELMIGGELNWGGTALPNKFIRPDKNTFIFAKADRLVKFAQANKMTILGGMLVWGPYYDPNRTYLPDWLMQGNFSRDELINIMQDHIKTVMTHYNGKISTYVVVNEPYPYNQGVDFWFDRIGEQYIDLAFEAARKADPNAVLILNDTANYVWGSQRTNYDYQTVQRLNNRSVQIDGKIHPLLDGVGIQLYVDAANPPTKEQLKTTFEHFGEAGVQVYITEALVNTSKLHVAEPDKQQVQAQIYADMLDACLQSKVCKSFTIFGFSDISSKYVVGSDAEASPFDENFNPKPAYFALRDVLSKYAQKQK
ncbi:MAG: endo-1,4-beta-xylanase [Chloroflexi bacterium]|nr:endo-1,4-beta-xylanase [Chloroflexota bacterium]